MRRLPVVLITLLAAALCACATPPANPPAPIRNATPAPVTQAAPTAPAPRPAETPAPVAPAPAMPSATTTPVPAPGGAASTPLAPTPPSASTAPAPIGSTTAVPPADAAAAGVATAPAAGTPAQPPAENKAAGPPVTVALLLPGQATPFARAAEAIRLGFFAAHGVANANVAIQMIEVDDNIAQLKTGLANAQKRGVKLVVGPLTRTLVNALGDGRVVAPVPVIALNSPESDAALSPDSLAFGLPVEAESRLLVRLALRELPAPQATSAAPRFLVLAGESALSRRMAAAFRDTLRDRGERSTQIDVKVGYTVLQTLTEQLAALRIDAIFCALDARETAFVRPRLPRTLPLYATSQVNLGGAESALLAPDLEGVKFVDMPWLIEPEHAAVMVYPRAEVVLSGELQRLYALGIDAYRVMVEWLAGNRTFELDGVTGRLRVDRARTARVERWPTVAVFRSGKIERLEQTE